MSAIDALQDTDGGRHGGGNKTALEGAVETRVLEPNPGNLWDILQFFRDNSDQIRYSLQTTLWSKNVSNGFSLCM